MYLKYSYEAWCRNILTLSFQEKLINSIFETPIIAKTLNINNLRTTSAKSINLHIIRTLIEYSLQRQCLLLLFLRYCCPKVSRYYQPPSGEQGAKGLKFQWKTKKIFRICWKCLKGDWLTSLESFEWVLNFFWFCLTLSVLEKLKNSIFEMPINPQTLNISNLRTTNGKSINLHTIRKLIEYSVKMFCKGNVYS